ncbi:Phosphate transporter PHO1-like 1 [Vitis vinifera]|uniref:Phosphate transporter PHO1-like 1 n=1 Tax=Vitis vinifera TaxID=29760 RepID=A0A438ECP4_VITVI|nr:Phosphate transporter PHO1-like 1 [Vitis vinifera]
MVKFSKQFEGQLVPEWKEAFVDYWQLKKDIKKIHLLSTATNNIPTANQQYSLPKTLFSSIRRFSLLAMNVHKKLASSASKGDLYETELLEQIADTDAANEFFACLDMQLNKVNQFYRTKEKEFLERGESLKEQMEILIELKSALKRQRNKGSTAQDPKEDASISCTISCEEESIKDKTEQEPAQDNTADEFESNDVQFSDSLKSDEMGKSMRMKREDGKLRTLSGRVFNCQGKNLRINIPLTTPSRTLSAISYLVWGDLVNQSSRKCGPEGSKLNINKTKLHHAEKILKELSLSFTKGWLSKNLQELEHASFCKDLEEVDKVTGKQVLPIYLKVVESSYFNSSDKVMKLEDEVEELFTKHFAEEDKRKTMKYLKPHQRKESHTVTFFIGLFTGCFIALFAGYVIMAHISGMYRGQSDTIYMETVYPVLSMFSLLFLHFFLYGCNIVMWRKARINYSFIFELAPTKELKYRDVFLICTTSMTAVVGVMFVHLSLVAKGNSYSRVQAIPGLLCLLFLLLLVCPFNIIYKSSRYRFLRVIRNTILSPLYKVVMLDFFMADQLCSQVPMLRNLEYVACYYITGSFKTQDYGFCMRTKHYRDLAYAVSFLPYYWRAMQRWFDEGQTTHLVNLGKYVSAMLAAGAKVAYEKERSVGWLALLWLCQVLQQCINCIGTMCRLQSNRAILAALEVIRRGQWNFYRLENEHLNNAGKFRAVKTVPLPFHEVDDED